MLPNLQRTRHAWDAQIYDLQPTLCCADIQPAPKHFEREQRVELPLPGTFTLDQLVGIAFSTLRVVAILEASGSIVIFITVCDKQGSSTLHA